MNIYDASEQAYKRGYEQGKKDARKTDGCEYCRGRAHTSKPFKVTTQLGRSVAVVFNFCPQCGADMRGEEDG